MSPGKEGMERGQFRQDLVLYTRHSRNRAKSGAAASQGTCSRVMGDEGAEGQRPAHKES